MVSSRVSGGGVGAPCSDDGDCHALRCELGACTKTCVAPGECPLGADCIGGKCVPASVVKANLSVRVAYAGTKKGALGIALHVNDPPVGPPALIRRIDRPTFPAVVVFEAPPPGRYFIRGLLDVDPPSSGAPGPEDAIVEKAVVVDWDGKADRSVDVSLPP